MHKRILKNLIDILVEYHEGDITNVSDISSKMYKHFGSARYSTSEIAGNMNYVREHYILMDEKDEYGLNCYTVHKG